MVFCAHSIRLLSSFIFNPTCLPTDAAVTTELISLQLCSGLVWRFEFLKPSTWNTQRHFVYHFPIWSSGWNLDPGWILRGLQIIFTRWLKWCSDRLESRIYHLRLEVFSQFLGTNGKCELSSCEQELFLLYVADELLYEYWRFKFI